MPLPPRVAIARVALLTDVAMRVGGTLRHGYRFRSARLQRDERPGHPKTMVAQAPPGPGPVVRAHASEEAEARRAAGVIALATARGIARRDRRARTGQGACSRTWRRRWRPPRTSWIEDQDHGYTPPPLVAICATQEGITVLTGWETDEDHKAFAHGMGPQLERAGATKPDGHEHLRIAKLGWSPRSRDRPR